MISTREGQPTKRQMSENRTPPRRMGDTVKHSTGEKRNISLKRGGVKERKRDSRGGAVHCAGKVSIDWCWKGGGACVRPGRLEAVKVGSW